MSRRHSRDYRRTKRGDDKYIFGTALEMEVGGSAGYVTVPDDDTLSPGTAGEMSWDWWANPDVVTSAATNTMISKLIGGQNEYLFRQNDAAIDLFIATSIFATVTAVWSTVLSIGVWTHFAMVYDGAETGDDRGRLYIDGVLTASDAGWSGTPNAVITGSTSQVTIGIRSDESAPTQFNGIMDEVAIYSVALTATEVLYNFQRRRVRRGLVSLWNLNGNVLDSVGSNDGTIGGAGGTAYVVHRLG